MKTFRTFLVPCLILLLIGCSSIKVTHDYDPEIDFSSLKTYDWLPLPDEAEINKLTVRRIKNAVNTQLEAKGLSVTPDNPDFLIGILLGKEQKVSVTDWGYPYGRYGRYWSGGVDVTQYDVGTITLDFVDAQSKELIWRGTAERELEDKKTPEKREQIINEAVEKMLENFPPQ